MACPLIHIQSVVLAQVKNWPSGHSQDALSVFTQCWAYYWQLQNGIKPCDLLGNEQRNSIYYLQYYILAMKLVFFKSLSGQHRGYSRTQSHQDYLDRLKRKLNSKHPVYKSFIFCHLLAQCCNFLFHFILLLFSFSITIATVCIMPLRDATRCMAFALRRAQPSTGM